MLLRQRLRTSLLAPAALLCALGVAISPPYAAAATAAASAVPAADAGPAHGVVGISDAHLDPRFWIARLPQADHVLLDAEAIAVQNERLLRLDRSMHDLRTMPARLPRAKVAGWITALSQRPKLPRFDGSGEPVTEATLDGLLASLDLDAIPAQQPTRYGLVVRRAALRTFPTSLRIFNQPGDTDIDRFQESALFPGDPVVIGHRSRDRDWLFVVSPRYAAWIRAEDVAEGPAAQVLGYAEKAPYRIVTGATARTVFTPQQPSVSGLQLEMGVRVPVLDRWPAGEAVNGQHPYTSHVIELPMRDGDGRLQLVPALLPRIADSVGEALPLTRANLISQSFKFLGERYGWGHDYNARDCSGFISEIYRGFGVQIPRNTGAQATSPALDPITFDTTPGGAARAAAIADLQAGDLVYIPGHVLLVIGHVDGQPYVIHDINGGSYLAADGRLGNLRLNGVSVTPLLPLMLDERQRYVDRITSIVRMGRAASAVVAADRGPTAP